jgi:hypothetical protein
MRLAESHAHESTTLIGQEGLVWINLRRRTRSLSFRGTCPAILPDVASCPPWVHDRRSFSEGG